MKRCNLYILCFILAILHLTSCSSGEFERSATFDIESATDEYSDQDGDFEFNIDLSVMQITDIDTAEEELASAKLVSSVFYLYGNSKLTDTYKAFLSFKTDKGGTYKTLAPIYIDPKTLAGYVYLDDFDEKYQKFMQTLVSDLIADKELRLTIKGKLSENEQAGVSDIPCRIQIRNDLTLRIRGEE